MKFEVVKDIKIKEQKIVTTYVKTTQSINLVRKKETQRKWWNNPIIVIYKLIVIYNNI